MRKSPPAISAARTATLNGGRSDAPAEVICMALALAIVVLVCRIAAVCACTSIDPALDGHIQGHAREHN